MDEKIITDQKIEKFRFYLVSEEKSRHTVDKYLRDVRKFKEYLAVSDVTKEKVILYKKYLIDSGYCFTSINSMLASINSFFTFMEWSDCKVKSLRIQRQIYSSQQKELTRKDYAALVNEAKRQNNDRLNLIMQTLCITGIRIGELEYITTEAVIKSEVKVNCKGKLRTVFISEKLQKKLIQYINKNHIQNGPLFVTKNGKPLSRSNIWKELKKLCKKAQVEASKVFPHNFRHLLARTFYGIEKDIAKLADLLGHSSINTTRIYIMSTGIEHQRIIEKMQLNL